MKGNGGDKDESGRLAGFLASVLKGLVDAEEGEDGVRHARMNSTNGYTAVVNRVASSCHAGGTCVSPLVPCAVTLARTNVAVVLQRLAKLESMHTVRRDTEHIWALSICWARSIVVVYSRRGYQFSFLFSTTPSCGPLCPIVLYKLSRKWRRAVWRMPRTLLQRPWQT